MLAIIAIFISMISVQIGASFAKSLFLTIGPLPTVMLRVVFAAIVMALFSRPWQTRLDRKTLKVILLYGASLGLMNLTFYLAITRIPLGICVALEFTGPLTVALFASKQRLDFLWALFAAVGVILILPLHSSQAPLSLYGIFLALTAGGFWALYIIFGKTLGTLIKGGAAASWGMLSATLVTVPAGLSEIHLETFNTKILVIAFAVAILSSAIPYSLEMFAMRKVATKTFGILMSLEPALAALSGLIFLHEQLILLQWLALIFIIVASVGSATTSKRIST
jgi:inner membrane transporter RhtA